jgi:hypothetical protein
MPDLMRPASNKSTSPALQFAYALKTRVSAIGGESPLQRRSRNLDPARGEAEIGIGAEECQEQRERNSLVLGQESSRFLHDIFRERLASVPSVLSSARSQTRDACPLVQIDPSIERCERDGTQLARWPAHCISRDSPEQVTASFPPKAENFFDLLEPPSGNRSWL